MTPVQTHALQLLLDISDMHWADYALCQETDPDAFFVEKGGSVQPARRVCMACPVRAECADYAISNDIPWGIWGALSPKQRRAVKHQRERQAA